MSARAPYALFVDRARVQTTTETTATLDIGAGDVEVRVAALNAGGGSPVGPPFPVLFDVAVRACTSDTLEVRWNTGKETDTQLSLERPGREHHRLLGSDAAGGARVRRRRRVHAEPGPDGHRRPGSRRQKSMTLNLLSRDELGFLGKYKRAFKMPPVGCVCATSSKAVDDSGCNPVFVNPMLPNQPPLTLPPCAPGFDLENGKLVTDVSQADVFMRGTEIASGALTEAWLVAPRRRGPAQQHYVVRRRRGAGLGLHRRDLDPHRE